MYGGNAAAAAFGSIPDAHSLPEVADDIGMFLCLPFHRFHGAGFATHLHALRFGKFPALVEAVVNVLPLFLELS